MPEDPTPVVAEPVVEKWKGRLRCGICGHERTQTVTLGDDGFTGPRANCPACDKDAKRPGTCHRVQG